MKIRRIFFALFLLSVLFIHATSAHRLHQLAREGDVTALKQYLQEAEDRGTDLSQILSSTAAVSQTPLMIASEKGNLEAVRVLLNYKSDPDSRAPRGATALSLATNSGNAEIVRLLLDSGAHPDGGPDASRLPLKTAIEGKNLIIIKLLLQHGASLKRFPDSSTRSLLEFAAQKISPKRFPEEHSQVVQMIQAESFKIVLKYAAIVLAISALFMGYVRTRGYAKSFMSLFLWLQLICIGLFFILPPPTDEIEIALHKYLPSGSLSSTSVSGLINQLINSITSGKAWNQFISHKKTVPTVGFTLSLLIGIFGPRHFPLFLRSFVYLAVGVAAWMQSPLVLTNAAQSIVQLAPAASAFLSNIGLSEYNNSTAYIWRIIISQMLASTALSVLFSPGVLTLTTELFGMFSGAIFSYCTWLLINQNVVVLPVEVLYVAAVVFALCCAFWVSKSPSFFFILASSLYSSIFAAYSIASLTSKQHVAKQLMNALLTPNSLHRLRVNAERASLLQYQAIAFILVALVHFQVLRRFSVSSLNLGRRIGSIRHRQQAPAQVR